MPKQGQSWVWVETPHYDASSSIFSLMQIKKEVQVEQHAPVFFVFFSDLYTACYRWILHFKLIGLEYFAVYLLSDIILFGSLRLRPKSKTKLS